MDIYDNKQDIEKILNFQEKQRSSFSRILS